MNLKRSILQAIFLVTALAGSLTLARPARAQAVSPLLVGKFKLTTSVHWGKSVLQPGTYTVRIDSTASPIMATIYNNRYTVAIRVMSLGTSNYQNGSNALRLKVHNGSLVVHSLVLADLNTVLNYDSSTDRENVEEAQADTTVPVLMARK